MKKSTYLIIGFLVFFLGTILALHIDSKNYEEEYIIKMKKELAISKERNDFYRARTNYRNDMSVINWKDFINKSKIYFSKDVANQNDYNSVSGFIATHYKKHSDTVSLDLAKEWAKKGMELNPKDGHMNDTYATILFNSGDIEEAIEQQTIAVEIIRKQNHRWTDLYMLRLERYKSFLSIEPIKIGDSYVDSNLFKTDGIPISLSKIIKNQVTILSFYAAGTKFNVIKHRQLLPLYNQYKNKGLQVVGVTKAHNTSKTLTKNILKENLPWVNLFDYKMQEKIWDKYGVTTSDNSFVLINKKGIIISNGESIEELKQQLNLLFNK
jgi:peroxiredoxin